MSGSFKNFRDWQPWRRDQQSGTPGAGPQRGPREFVEEIRTNGQNLVGEVEKLLREGEIRRLRIRQNDKILLDVPIALAAVGALIAPVLAAVAAVAAVVTDCTVEVIRTEDRRPPVTKVTPAKPASPAGSTPPSTNPDDLSYR